MNTVHIKSISEVHQIFGFDKPKHPLVTVLPIDKRMTNFDYGNFQYYFDFYQISLKSGIKGSLSYGRNSYDFEEGTMTFIRPNQLVKVEDSADYKNGNGWTLLFHPDLISKSELGKTINSYSFFNYEVSEALHVSNEEKRTLKDLVLKIEREYSQNIDKHSQELIIANIEMILKYAKRYYDRQFYTRTNLNQDLLSKFDKVIHEYYLLNKQHDFGVLSVNYCAKQLALSPNYFGDLIKAETNKSAKEHIQDFIINRAKTFILNPHYSISEVAYNLGYEHPQSFTKLFKAKTGMSPSKYKLLG